MTTLNLYLENHPHRNIPDIVKALTTQTLIAGLTPMEVLAMVEGEAQYTVKPDSLVWPMDSKPFDVMKAQTDRPDNSDIWMMIEMVKGRPIRVEFSRGRMVRSHEIPAYI